MDGADVGIAGRLRSAIDAVGRVLLPAVCASCDRLLGYSDDSVVCGACWSLLPRLPAPECRRCGHPTWGRAECRWCTMLPPFVRAGRSVCWERGTARTIVHALKYDGWTRVAGEMALRMSRLEWPSDVIAERSALIPVPLAATRERERGFNQSALLAAELGRRWGLPVWGHGLVRSRRTVSQTQLTPDQRRDNVRGAFRATAPCDLAGRHVILVDDVVTTAATLNACAAALIGGGARIVSFVTFGRAPALGDRC